MRIIYSNLLDNYTLTESQEDANYPVENVQDIRLAKRWRTTTASATTVLIDAGTGLTITCDACSVLAHNFTASAGIFVQAGTEATLATPSLSAQVTFREDIMVRFFASTTDRFWQFTFDETTLAAGYYEVGRLFLGEYLQMDPSSLVEFPEKHPRSDQQHFSVSNQIYTDEGIEHKELDYRFEHAGGTTKTAIETMWNSCGKFKPLLLMNYDTSYATIPPLYASVTNDIIFEHLKFDKWSFDISLREAD